jgi:hypothetical protein
VKCILIVCALVLASSGAVPAADSAGGGLEFIAPTLERPAYLIRFVFEVAKRSTTPQGLLVNGASAESVLVFKDGSKADFGAPLGPGSYTFLVGFAWRSNAPYRIALTHLPSGARKSVKFEAAGTSPTEGGLPSPRCEEGFHRVLRVEEDAGLARMDEIVTATLTAPKLWLEDGRLCLYDGTVAVPHQVLEARSNEPAAAAAKDHPPTLTLKLAFPVGLRPREAKLILAVKGDPAPPPDRKVSIEGDGLGKTVRNPFFKAVLHPGSGQINALDYTAEGVKLHNRAGVIHWNPDCFIPGLAWDHSFDWNPPAVFEEKTGALLYRNLRRGPMPRIKDVELEVLYTIAADAPWILSETRLTAANDLAVIAVRNDEMVFSKELFDALIYKSRRRGVVQAALAPKPGLPFGLAGIGPEDADWVGLLNTRENYGFFCLRVQELNAAVVPAGPFLHKPGTYFYAPSDGDYVYWVRPLLYTWGDYGTNAYLTALPKGSVFYERNAYLALRLGRDFRERLDAYLVGLRNPVKVF